MLDNLDSNAPALKSSRDVGPTHAGDLLTWYDRHRRRLPWRALPGEAPDPYRVWLSEIMLQQTTVKTVGPYFEAFVARWPSVAAMAASDIEDILKAWAGLGYYSRARNRHACARFVSERLGGHFPDDIDGLRQLPGVAPTRPRRSRRSPSTVAPGWSTAMSSAWSPGWKRSRRRCRRPSHRCCGGRQANADRSSW